MTGQDGEANQEQFQDILYEAKTLSLPPECCVPCVKIRKISESGVRRLMQSFRKKMLWRLFISWSICRGKLAYGYSTHGFGSLIPQTYFTEEMGYSESDADAEVSKFSSWFGIVEGCHRKESLRRLVSQNPSSFASFTWTVLVLRPAPKHTLRAFARNDLGSKIHPVGFHQRSTTRFSPCAKTINRSKVFPTDQA